MQLQIGKSNLEDCTISPAGRQVGAEPLNPLPPLLSLRAASPAAGYPSGYPPPQGYPPQQAVPPAGAWGCGPGYGPPPGAAYPPPQQGYYGAPPPQQQAGYYPPQQGLPARPPGAAKPPGFDAYDVEAAQAGAAAAAFMEQKVRAGFIRKVRLHLRLRGAGGGVVAGLRIYCNCGHEVGRPCEFPQGATRYMYGISHCSSV